MSQWFQLVRELAPVYGIDPDLATRVMQAESAGNPAAVSPKGARGLMQLMDATAARFKVDSSDPVQNVKGGLQYLRVLLDEFKDPRLAVAAYNAGEGAVRKHGGIPPYPETQAYVKKIFGDDSSATGAVASARTSETQPMNTLPPAGIGIEPLPDMYNQPTWVDRLATNPFIQMGLGILADPTMNPARGAQVGLLSAQHALNSYRRYAQGGQPQMERIIQGDQMVQGYRLPNGQFQVVGSGPRWPTVGQGSQANLYGRVNVGDYTPESLAAFDQSVQAGQPDYSILRHRGGAGGNLVYGSVPQGAVRVIDPATGESRIQYEPNSKHESELRQSREKIATAVANIRRLQDLIDKHGVELFGQKSGEMANLYGDIQTAVRLAQEMGAPQAEELRMLAHQLPNPTEVNLSPNFKARAKGAYDEAARRLTDSLKFIDRRYATEVYGGTGPATAPPSGSLPPPPGFTEALD